MDEKQIEVGDLVLFPRPEDGQIRVGTVMALNGACTQAFLQTTLGKCVYQMPVDQLRALRAAQAVQA